MRVEDTTAELLIGFAGLLSMGFYILVGKYSDRVGRKKPIIWGNILTLILLFPCFWFLGQVANSDLQASVNAAPITVSGPDCDYDPFADEQVTNCGRLLQDMTGFGIPYQIAKADIVSLDIGTQSANLSNYNWNDAPVRVEQLQKILEKQGYDLADQTPSAGAMIGIIAVLLVLGGLSAANYGSVAALLTEMFPAKIRYSSMSIPYHIGAGYFGGFLPLIAFYIVAQTGDIYAGLWYTWVFILIATIVAAWGLKNGPPTDFSDDL